MHRIVLSFAFIGLSAGFMVMGCGTDTKNQTSTGTPETGVPLANVTTEFAKYYCGLLFSCCDMAEQDALKVLDPVPKTEAECQTAAASIAESETYGALKEAVAAGRLAYDADEAAACFASISKECNTFAWNLLGAYPTCATAFTGKVADGGACQRDLECALGSVCDDITDPMLWKCKPLPKENEPCAGPCQEGLLCTIDMPSVCIKPKADGSACNVDTVECASEYCDSTSKCAPRKANGEMCDSTNECKDGYCDGGTKLCTAPKAIGEACMSFLECATHSCDLTTKKCLARRCDGM